MQRAGPPPIPSRRWPRPTGLPINPGRAASSAGAAWLGLSTAGTEWFLEGSPAPPRLLRWFCLADSTAQTQLGISRAGDGLPHRGWVADRARANHRAPSGWAAPVPAFRAAAAPQPARR